MGAQGSGPARRRLPREHVRRVTNGSGPAHPGAAARNSAAQTDMACPMLRRIHRSVAMVDVHEAHALRQSRVGYHAPAWRIAATDHPSGSREAAWMALTVSLHGRVRRRARDSCPLRAARRIRHLPLLLPSIPRVALALRHATARVSPSIISASAAARQNDRVSCQAR